MAQFFAILILTPAAALLASVVLYILWFFATVVVGAVEAIVLTAENREDHPWRTPHMGHRTSGTHTPHMGHV